MKKWDYKITKLDNGTIELYTKELIAMGNKGWELAHAQALVQDEAVYGYHCFWKKPHISRSK